MAREGRLFFPTFRVNRNPKLFWFVVVRRHGMGLLSSGNQSVFMYIVSSVETTDMNMTIVPLQGTPVNGTKHC